MAKTVSGLGITLVVKHSKRTDDVFCLFTFFLEESLRTISKNGFEVVPAVVFIVHLLDDEVV